jgi:hypothetical protein
VGAYLHEKIPPLLNKSAKDKPQIEIVAYAREERLRAVNRALGTAQSLRRNAHTLRTEGSGPSSALRLPGELKPYQALVSHFAPCLTVKR